MIKLLMFDLDGTLIDSAPDIIDSTNTLLERRGLEPFPDEVITNAIGEGLQKFLFDLFPHVKNDPAFVKALELEFIEVYSRNLLNKTKEMPGIIGFLESCQKQIAIITNKYEFMALKTISKLELGRFTWLKILGADSLPQRKPHPLPLIETMRAAGVTPDECLMIGDGSPDILAAKQAGVRSVAVEFGYTDISILKSHGATFTLPHYDQLQDLISSL